MPHTVLWLLVHIDKKSLAQAAGPARFVHVDILRGTEPRLSCERFSAATTKTEIDKSGHALCLCSSFGAVGNSLRSSDAPLHEHSCPKPSNRTTRGRAWSISNYHYPIGVAPPAVLPILGISCLYPSRQARRYYWDINLR